jgi:uncharacterized protein
MTPPRRPSDARRHASHPIVGCLGSVLLLIALLCAGTANAVESIDQFPSSPLSIRTRAGTEWFSVWIADTAAREQQGLMYQRWLPVDRGMLFPQAEPRVMTMWMKNTLIPLDMLFIDAQGRIVYIRENTTPQSEDLISAPAPVKAVLELAGGLSAKHGIHVGDRVLHPLFGSAPIGPVRN